MIAADSRLAFVCAPDNDLYRVLAESGRAGPRYEQLAEALAATPAGGGVLCLADDYPAEGIDLDEDLLELAAARDLRLYVEYPSSLLGQTLGEARPARLERLVVASDFFAPALPRQAILTAHGCWFRPVQAEQPHLVAARVAGYRRAVYGLPDEVIPILFELPGREVMVSATKLSQFVTGRYGPAADWRALWETLLRWLSRSESIPPLVWTASVDVTARPETRLPEGSESTAFARSVRWLRGQALASADGKTGALEGFASPIDHLGRQPRRAGLRADCTAETALVFALDWSATGDPSSRDLAGQLLDYVWSAPDFLQTEPESPAYGLVNWYDRVPVFYGDDNARVILSTLAAARHLGDDRWSERVLRCLLANLRTAGRLGFRRNRVDLADLGSGPDGWQALRDESVVSYSPHYQAYLWAASLWAHALTGNEGFLRPARSAIEMTMSVYPRWQWTNGLTQELARMLLPLAFLIRVDDSAEHRGWLDRVADDLLASLQPSGAIRERQGRLEDGQYPSPRDNASYGRGEASIIHENGDPACDLLYTMNYAFLGLHEAAGATGDGRLKQAEDQLADFLCRIQARSVAQPELDGAWPRSFDYELWEYWGSSADQGWGAWSVESGWTNTWIPAVFALRRLGLTLFDLGADGGLGEGGDLRDDGQRGRDRGRGARLASRLPALLVEMGLARSGC